MTNAQRKKTLIAIGLLLFGGCVVLLQHPRFQGLRWAARVTHSKNNLKQLGLAVHNYHDMYDIFPPGGTFNVDGTPHHSWQSMLLPYLESSPLYSQIDFDRPWTDPVNQQVFETDYPIFLNPCEPRPRSLNGYAVSQYSGNSRILMPNGSMTIKDIADGTSNTLLAGEVSHGLKAWGDPTNTRDPSAGLGQTAEQFGSSVLPRVLFLLADGSVRAVSLKIDQGVLSALSTPDGSELISENSW